MALIIRGQVMTRRRKRLYLVAFLLAGIGTATALSLVAFRKNMMYFYSPSQVAGGAAAVATQFRLGGLVKKGSVRRASNGLDVRFILTDRAHSVAVRYHGILPDLFREGQGIVAHGHLGPNGVFVADQVLAKHDASYMPPNVKDALDKAKRSAQAGGAAPARIAAANGAGK